MSKQFFQIEGNFKNQGSDDIAITGYYGSYILIDPNGNEVSAPSNSIPYFIIPPGYGITGGTRATGIIRGD